MATAARHHGVLPTACMQVVGGGVAVYTAADGVRRLAASTAVAFNSAAAMYEVVGARCFFDTVGRRFYVVGFQTEQGLM